MSIPFLEVVGTYRELRQDIMATIEETLSRGQYILGPALEKFESDFARYTEAAECVGVGSGLEALILVLRARGVGPGDEVIVPSHTAIPTWIAVTECGATPIPWEPRPNTYHVDPTLLEGLITERTRAIIPVHLYGQCADMVPIQAIARRYNLFILEDAAQAHGATINGHPPGFYGDAAAWSFYPSKNLGAFGDGGAITTNNKALADALRLLRNYGSSIKYINEIPGVNSRLDDLHAAILSVKLSHLNRWNARRKAIARRYLNELQQTSVILPTTDADNSVWHIFPIQHEKRDHLQTYLHEQGVGTLIHYPIPPHRQAAYTSLNYLRGSLPVAETIANRELSLPMGPHFTDDQITDVINAIKRYRP